MHETNMLLYASMRVRVRAHEGVSACVRVLYKCIPCYVK